MGVGAEIKDRSILFDNLKGILIILVVFGHMINILFKFQHHDSEVISIVWRYMYLFHMPCFIIISGYFSKKYSVDGILKKLIIPYIVFNSLFFVMHKNFTFPIFADSAMWYMFALCIWRISIPYLTKVRYIFPLSVICALIYDLIGIENENIGGVAKVIIFLPFFLIGYYCTEEHIEKLRSKKGRYIILLIFIVIFGLFVALQSFGIQYTDEMLYAKTDSISFDVSGLIIFGMRKLSGLLGVIISLLLISIIPTTKTRCSVLGQRTLTIYLFHYLPIIQFIIRKIPVPKKTEFLFAECILATVVLCYIFSRPVVVKYYDLLLSWIEERILLPSLKKD